MPIEFLFDAKESIGNYFTSLTIAGVEIPSFSR